MQRAIKESQAELESTVRAVPRVSTTAQEQMVALQKLGLQEAEAVEYALMLSHEEALKAGVLTNSPSEDSGEDRKSQKGSMSTSVSPPSTSLRTSPRLHATGKVQVAWLEPMSVSGLTGLATPVSRAASAEEFPSISASPSPGSLLPIDGKAENKKQGRISNANGSSPVAGRVTPPTPTKPVTSSWSAIVKSSACDAEEDKKGKKHSATVQRRPPAPISDEEAQLQLALELSLAEALSEGSRDG
jgi:hypothetical protein